MKLANTQNPHDPKQQNSVPNQFGLRHTSQDDPNDKKRKRLRLWVIESEIYDTHFLKSNKQIKWECEQEEEP